MSLEPKRKYGDRVMVAVLVPATIRGQTNQRAPDGTWWILVDGEIGLRAVHESEFVDGERMD